MKMHCRRARRSCLDIDLLMGFTCIGFANGAYDSKWSQALESIVNLEKSHPKTSWIAVFDVDGTIIREKPTLLEVAWAKHALCSGGTIANTRLANICSGQIDVKQLTYPKEVYQLLMLPFANWTTDAYHDAAAKWIKAQANIVYEAVAELVNWLTVRGWKVLLVSQTMGDTCRALVTAAGLDVHGVIGTEPDVTLDIGTDPILRRGMHVHGPLMNGDEKVRAIWAREGALPLFAMGNSAGDMPMLRSAKLGVMIDHTSTYECPACEYPVWHVGGDLQANASAYDWRIVPVDSLPRPLFRTPTHIVT